MHASALTDAGRACTQHSAPMLMPMPPAAAHPPKNNTSSSRPAGQQARPACVLSMTMWTHMQPKAVYGVRRGGMPRAKSSLAQQAYPSPRGCGPSPVAIARYRCTRKKTFCRPHSWDHTTLTLPCQLPVPYKPAYARKLPNYTTSTMPTFSSAAGPIPLPISETPVFHPMPTIAKQ
ncbi:hypothetical protein COCMIDRAFT_38062 [Bipolaris oryzae ATCC 44560]|uniref:Uncharacterized protein n=1 Tax=Bipolaris oryzae ATCC 44560 TaxID=930090 RepID=W6Z952_COCMI|nr:uncharacterized protein COCMIDRAFT_38062 [Bipolaris oryzae ATCC 44560]EUC44089.1 hypothetical protein COCMIDRAFT_38062 [Bipolaris oryzae ATCC 44560]